MTSINCIRIVMGNVMDDVCTGVNLKMMTQSRLNKVDIFGSIALKYQQLLAESLGKIGCLPKVV